MGKGRQSQILGRSDTIHVCSLLTVATKLALILQLLVSANPTVWNLLIDHIADPVRIFPVLCRGSKLSSDETTSLSLVFVVGRRNRKRYALVQPFSRDWLSASNSTPQQDYAIDLPVPTPRLFPAVIGMDLQ